MRCSNLHWKGEIETPTIARLCNSASFLHILGRLRLLYTKTCSHYFVMLLSYLQERLPDMTIEGHNSRGGSYALMLMPIRLTANR